MMEIGWLAPDGTMIECALMDHVATATELAEKMGWKEYDADFHRTPPDDFLMEHGFVHITRGMFFDRNYHIMHKKHYTQPQKDWLKPRVEDNWDNLNSFCQMDWGWENNEDYLKAFDEYRK